jgi:hypothetical protein
MPSRQPTCPKRTENGNARWHQKGCAQFRPATCKHPDRPWYAKGVCHYCYHSVLRFKNDPGRKKDGISRRKRVLRRRYGISPEEYNQLFEAQGGVCAICHRPCRSGRALAVDHDHHTGKVRGLLCVCCNQAIGAFGDDPEVMSRALRYLRLAEQAQREGTAIGLYSSDPV